MYYIKHYPHSWVIKIDDERAACSGRLWAAQQKRIDIPYADYYTVFRILLRTGEIKLKYNNSVLLRMSYMPWDTTE